MTKTKSILVSKGVRTQRDGGYGIQICKITDKGLANDG